MIHDSGQIQAVSCSPWVTGWYVVLCVVLFDPAESCGVCVGAIDISQLGLPLSSSFEYRNADLEPSDYLCTQDVALSLSVVSRFLCTIALTRKHVKSFAWNVTLLTRMS